MSPGHEAPPEPKPEPMPARLGKYDVRAKIGEGGMAEVHLGRDTSENQRGDGGNGRVVALKVIKDEYSRNPDFVNMFLDEAKIVSTLKHPNLIEVYELDREGTRLFIAMELLRGQSLWHVWMACRDRNVRLRYDVAAWIAARVADGLHHAHEAVDEHGKALGVVHRDVNASNIFVTYDGVVKVIDFGLAKAANRVSKTAAGVVKGKFAYMSPEQALGKAIDRTTDVFALAVTLWELTVDRRLFKGKDDFETLRKVSDAQFRNPAALVEGYPEELIRVLRKALDPDRTKRYATARELADALDRFAHTEGQRDGQTPNAELVARVMRELFVVERAREQEWLAEASAVDRPPPRDSLRPPPAPSAEPELSPSPPALARMSAPPRVSAPPIMRLFAPPPIRPPPGAFSDDGEAEAPGHPHAPDASASERPFDAKRAVLMAMGLLILIAVAMIIGAWWGRHAP